jgi:DNA-binding NarL/FixJ family response regulator
MASIRTFLVDDNATARRAVATYLAMTPGIEVVGQASDGREALAAVPLCQPDLVLMDWTMPGLSGLEATQQLTAQGAAPPVVLLTLHEGAEYAQAAAAAGAAGLVSKAAVGEQLLPLLAGPFPVLGAAPRDLAAAAT